MNKTFFNKNSISNFVADNDFICINLVGGGEITVHRSNNCDFNKLIEKLYEMLRCYSTDHHVACYDDTTGRLTID